MKNKEHALDRMSLSMRISERGLTLVETVVGAALLMLTFGALVLSFTRMSQMSVGARYSFEAMHTLRSEIESLRMLPYVNVVSFTNIPITNTLLAAAGGKKHCYVTPYTNQYKEVNMMVTWHNPANSATSRVSIATLICNTNSAP